MLLGKIKYYAMLIGATLLAIAAATLRIKTLKNQRDRAREEAARQKAVVHVGKVKEKERKKQQDSLLLKEERIKEEVEKKGEDFKGLDNLRDPNDF